MPKVSVIIPAYNAEKFIGATLDSVIAQSFPDWEAVVVDDGSTDGTAAIVKDYAGRDSRIRYIHQENASQAMARNKGIENSTGEFIAFLDADDLWLPGKLAAQLPMFDDPSIGLAYTEVGSVDVEGNPIHQPPPPFRRGKVLEQLIHNNFIGCSSVMLRRSCLEDHQLRFRAGRKGVEDWDLWLRLAQRCEFDFINKPLVRYRKYDESISQNRDLMIKSIFTTFDDLKNSLAESPESGKLNNLIDKSLSKQLSRYAHWLLGNKRGREAVLTMNKALKQYPRSLSIYWSLIKLRLKYLTSK